MMLGRKMVRDVRKNFAQFLMIFLMVMVGVMMHAGILGYMLGMEQAAEKFYAENNLQDLQVYGRNFGEAELQVVREIPGVRGVERRVVWMLESGELGEEGRVDEDVLDGGGRNEERRRKTLLGNFIKKNEIAKMHVYAGEEFDGGAGVWLDQMYGEKNGIGVGDEIVVRYGQWERKERVRGLVSAPDQIYVVRDRSELLPNREEFGFGFLAVEELPMEMRMFSQMLVDVADEGQVENVALEIRRRLGSIGVSEAGGAGSGSGSVVVAGESGVIEGGDVVARGETGGGVKEIVKGRDLPGQKMYQGEIDEGGAYVGVFSGLFLSIAVLSVVTTMTRMVQRQRTEIGTLKALGFTDWRILAGFVGCGVGVAGMASVVGLILGYFVIGRSFMELEMSIFAMPKGGPVLGAESFGVAGLGVMLIAGVVILVGRGILRENPAETLRFKAPRLKMGGGWWRFYYNIKNVFVKRFSGRRNGFVGEVVRFLRWGRVKREKCKNLRGRGMGRFARRWNYRDMVRNGWRTTMGVVGLAGCCVLMVCAFGMMDTMEGFVALRFEKLYNFRYKINLKSERSEVENAAVLARHGQASSQGVAVQIYGRGGEVMDNDLLVVDAGDLVRFADRQGELMPIEDKEGVYVARRLAERLDCGARGRGGCEAGGKVYWRVRGEEGWREARVAGVNSDPERQGLTMGREAFLKFGLKYWPDAIYTDEDLSRMKESERLGAVKDVQSLASLKEGVMKVLERIRVILGLVTTIAVGLGAVIVYNIGMLAYVEKERQFATLMVLGFEERRVRRIFVEQNLYIGGLAVTVGLVMGKWLLGVLMRSALRNNYDFETVVGFWTFVMVGVGAMGVIWGVSWWLALRMRKIDMVMSLKEGE